MKTIKTFALLLVALFVVQGAMAQTRTKSVVQTDSTTVVTIVKTLPKFSPKHDLRVGIGTVSIPSIVLLDEGWGYDRRAGACLPPHLPISRPATLWVTIR